MNVKSFVKNNKFLSLVLASYLGLFIFKTPMAFDSLKNSAYYFKEMLIIMPVIMLLTALLNAWVPTETIERHLGASSGPRGSVFAFMLGSISAGPIYAAFPVAIALLKKGASITNIVVLLSSWAVVKIPMLANEAKFLGPKFMIIRWILTTITIFTTGYIVSKFVSRKEVLDLHEDEEREKLYLPKEYCTGCSLCANLDPEHFVMNDGKAKVISQENLNSPQLLEAVEACPVDIISLND